MSPARRVLWLVAAGLLAAGAVTGSIWPAIGAGVVAVALLEHRWWRI